MFPFQFPIYYGAAQYSAQLFQDDWLTSSFIAADWPRLIYSLVLDQTSITTYTSTVTPKSLVPRILDAFWTIESALVVVRPLPLSQAKAVESLRSMTP